MSRSFNEAEFGKVLNVAFNVHPIVGVGERNEFPRRASDADESKAAIPVDRLGSKLAGAGKDAGLNCSHLTEQRDKLQKRPDRFGSRTGGSRTPAQQCWIQSVSAQEPSSKMRRTTEGSACNRPTIDKKEDETSFSVNRKEPLPAPMASERRRACPQRGLNCAG